MYDGLNPFHAAIRSPLRAGVVAWLCLAATAALAAGPPPPSAASVSVPPVGLTLEQAVAQVQNETRGKVLRADTRQLGKRITEYRIKVLTPDGHVRVVPVRTKNAPSPNDKEKR